jgi:hypothetical protein
MIKISEIKKDYYEASSKLSDIVRQLDFAGIAIYWLIRVGKDTGGITYSSSLRWPLALFIASLTFDLFQYLYKSLMLGLSNTYFYRQYKNEEKEVYWSGKRNWPTNVFFWGKALFVVAAYLLLLMFMQQQLFPTGLL